jgi:uncharacterized protein YacL
MRLFIRYFLIVLLALFLTWVGYAVMIAILRKFTPFFDTLPVTTKAPAVYSISGICLFVIAAYDALTRIRTNPWTDKVLAIINVICAVLGAVVAAWLAGILYLFLRDLPLPFISIIGGIGKPPNHWLAAAAAGVAIHLYGFWGIERLRQRPPPLAKIK